MNHAPRPSWPKIAARPTYEALLIHRAIDCVTAVTIECQSLRRHLQPGALTSPEVMERIDAVEERIAEIAEILIAIRDEPRLPE